MVPYRSLDKFKLIAALLHDVELQHGAVFNHRSCRLTTKVVERRLASEGIGFLTKTLPSLGKAFDKALSGALPLTASKLRFKPQTGSELPRFLGEFFNRVLHKDGTLLSDPCAESVKVIRLICYLFYKYEEPYTADQEQQVVDRFEGTERDLERVDYELKLLEFEYTRTLGSRVRFHAPHPIGVLRNARKLLNELFKHFDPMDIYPQHGPGAVATKQQAWSKYLWTNVCDRITDVYPFDEYFRSSFGHVCDTYASFRSIGTEDLPARVCLVPKDSRGPRLISCEPVDFQWIQQGLRKAIVQLVESHPLTKEAVFFTDQRPNQIGALFGSYSGRYATLDLKDASDRVSLRLVHLLFPEHVLRALDCCRSSATVLPSGKKLVLRKFAPMGSSLCFPIMALTIWALLSASAPDADTRTRIHVYGDDVIVPTAYAALAIEQLELFGLKVNRDKSCISGLFRESCGCDAFNGVVVTPVRLRTVWSSTPSPESYASWLAYANSFAARKYMGTYEYIVGLLTDLYWPIPTEELHLGVPSLPYIPFNVKPTPRRLNPAEQRWEHKVLVVKAPVVEHELDGWDMLLRFFVENSSVHRDSESELRRMKAQALILDEPVEVRLPFKVRSYTLRRTSKLVRRWL